MTTDESAEAPMIIDLVDGTYELFRHFFGIRRFRKEDPPLGAVLGVVRTVVGMLEQGSTHLGVATDHVVESFRNDLWPGYKTGAGIEPVLRAQFHPLEEALDALGVTVWPMVEFEADDALAAAAARVGDDPRVTQVRIWTPDKDLAQCVRGSRVVQVDRRRKEVRDEAAVTGRFGVPPSLIPDYLALVGDSADGFPGISGIGPAGAARLLNRHGPLESLPPDRLGDRREEALLFRTLATLRTDVAVFQDVQELHWQGPRPGFGEWAARLGDPGLTARCAALLARRTLSG
jgi:5'-3' exonuclease